MDDTERDPGPGAEALAGMADLLAWPLLLTRADGTVVHANLAARRVLREGRALRTGPDGRLQAGTAAQCKRLAAVLADAARGQAAVCAMPDGPIAAARPLRRPADGARTQAVPVLLALACSQADTTPFVRANGLSPAEARVLGRLAAGEDVETIAGALRVTPATVRSQIAAVRRKCGANSMARLVCAVSRGSPLLRAISEQGE